jgi:asparagine synthase (glutamine-hydrolysing)
VPQKGRALHTQYLNNSMLPYSLEMINRLSSAFGVEVRVPFCDRQLVEYCLAIPPQLKLNGGWSRYIIRKAMSGVLPEKVQWRGGKISLAKVYPYMMKRCASEYVMEMLEHPPEPLTRYINMPAIRTMYQSFLREDNTADLEWVWQTVIFAAWMRQAGSVV